MEIEILNFIHQNLVNPFFDVIFVLFTTIVEHGEIWILAGLVMLFTKKYRITGILLLIALVCTFVSSELIIKNLACRPRPFYANPNISLIISPPSGYSFPSSHSAVSFSSAAIIFYFNKKLGIVGLFVASLTAFSRIYLYVHYPTDVLAGICLGLLWAGIVIFVYKRIAKSRKTTSTESST